MMVAIFAHVVSQRASVSHAGIFTALGRDAPLRRDQSYTVECNAILDGLKTPYPAVLKTSSKCLQLSIHMRMNFKCRLPVSKLVSILVRIDGVLLT